MRSAYILLAKGYYASVITLLRSVYENWLMAEDCQIHPPTLELLMNSRGELGRGKFTFTKMAKRVGVESKWKTEYGHLSSIAHPRNLSLAILERKDNKLLRLGPSYNALLFLDCCENFIQCAVLMMQFLAALLKDEAEEWHHDALAIVDAANALLQNWRLKYGSNE